LLFNIIVSPPSMGAHSLVRSAAAVRFVIVRLCAMLQSSR
jgi:hypothetical protein